MRNQTRYGWRWMLLAIGGLAWLSIGCNPQSISMLLLPFVGDNNVQPEFPLFAKNKEITLVIMSNFARDEINADLRPAAAELANEVAAAFKKRLADNSHKIKIIPAVQVRAQQLNQMADGLPDPVAIGKHFKADYVLDLTINSISLYEKNFQPPMFRGRADVNIDLYKVDAKEGERKVHNKVFGRVFPKGPSPMDASSISAAGFRQGFLRTTANDLVKVFIAYAPEERHMME